MTKYLTMSTSTNTSFHSDSNVSRKWKFLHLMPRDNIYIGKVGAPVNTKSLKETLDALKETYGNVNKLHKQVDGWMKANFLFYSNSPPKWTLVDDSSTTSLWEALTMLRSQYGRTIMDHSATILKWSKMGLYRTTYQTGFSSYGSSRMIRQYKNSLGNFVSADYHKINSILTGLYGNVDVAMERYNARGFTNHHTKSPEGCWYNNDRLGFDDDRTTFEPKAEYAFFITVESAGTEADTRAGSDGSPEYYDKKVTYKNIYEISVDIFSKAWIQRCLGHGRVFRGDSSDFADYFNDFNNVPSDVIDATLLAAFNGDHIYETPYNSYSNSTSHEVTKVTVEQVGGIDYF